MLIVSFARRSKLIGEANITVICPNTRANKMAAYYETQENEAINYN